MSGRRVSSHVHPTTWLAHDKLFAHCSFKLRGTAMPRRGRLHGRRVDTGRRGCWRSRRGGSGSARRGRREVRDLRTRARQQRVRLRHRRVQVRVGPRVARQRLLRQAPTRWSHTAPAQRHC